MGRSKKKRQVMLDAKAKRKAANKEYSKAFNKSSTLLGAYGRGNKERHDKTFAAAKAANAADAAYKKAKKDYKNAKKQARNSERAKAKADKALAKMEKTKYKDTIKQYRKEINAGESAVGKIYNKLTSADKYQAEIRYDMEQRAKVNKNWRD